MRDDINLVEDDTRIQDIKCRVVEGTGEDDVFEELKAVGVVNFSLDYWVVNWYWLVELGGLFEEITVVGFVGGKIGVI